MVLGQGAAVATVGLLAIASSAGWLVSGQGHDGSSGAMPEGRAWDVGVRQAPPTGSPEGETATVPVDWSGTTGSGARACETGFLSACVGRAVRHGDPILHLRLPGTMSDAALTLTWRPDSELTQNLRFRLVGMAAACGCDDGDAASPLIEEVEGPSPLVLSLTGLDGMNVTSVHVSVSPAPASTGVAEASATTDQDFIVEGRIVLGPGTALTTDCDCCGDEDGHEEP